MGSCLCWVFILLWEHYEKITWCLMVAGVGDVEDDSGLRLCWVWCLCRCQSQYHMHLVWYTSSFQWFGVQSDVDECISIRECRCRCGWKDKWRWTRGEFLHPFRIQVRGIPTCYEYTIFVVWCTTSRLLRYVRVCSDGCISLRLRDDWIGETCCRSFKTCGLVWDMVLWNCILSFQFLFLFWWLLFHKKLVGDEWWVWESIYTVLHHSIETITFFYWLYP